VHLGEKFHVRVTDPDHDITNERDSVKVRVRSASGSDVTMNLTETLPHSGVFSGSIEPTFAGAKAPEADRALDPVLGSQNVAWLVCDLLVIHSWRLRPLDQTSPDQPSRCAHHATERPRPIGGTRLARRDSDATSFGATLRSVSRR
jgi:hypothetical protein